MSLSPLTDEILLGTPERVARMLKDGADVNEIDVYGFTPLIEAVIMNSMENVEQLLQHGAEINKKDMVGRTALHWAVDNQNLQLSQFLLEKGAQANAYNKDGQSILVQPLLRQQQNFKTLLYHHGADLKFAQDYINAKLIGHRFELAGIGYIANPKETFIEVNFEGFFLEFSIAIIFDSLRRYKNNYAARNLRSYFPYFQKMISAFAIAEELIQYQHYTVKVDQHLSKIKKLLNTDLLIIPIAHRGHATTFIRYHNFLLKCDRGANSKIEGSVVVYEVGKPQALSDEFIMSLIYKKQSPEFMQSGLKQFLGLNPIMTLPVPPQLTGNCSWANVEACVPAILFLLLHEQSGDIQSSIDAALSFFNEWHEWDKDRALYDCIQYFYSGSVASRASKAVILAMVLFQRCDASKPKDLERAEKILEILTMPEYGELLKKFVKTYCKNKDNKFGQNLLNLLELAGRRMPFKLSDILS